MLLAYEMSLRNIRLTGKRPPISPLLTVGEARSIIEDGRGWANYDRDSFYNKLSTDELMGRLGNWSPIVRKRAAAALARRKAAPMDALLEMLESGTLYQRYGACDMFRSLKSAAAPAVPALTRTLDHDDLWLRVNAADALAAIGDPARSTVPKLLEMVTRGPTRTDPRGMEQRFLCFALFNGRGGMLSRSLEGIGRDALRAAMTAGLQNQDGRARGSIGSVYPKLEFEEVRPLLPAIYRAIIEPAPSGIMFASGIRLEGLKLLAKHKVREGIPLCVDVMEIDKWGKRQRITNCLKTLETYGTAARPILPKLYDLKKRLLAHWEAKGLKPQIDHLDKVIADIESDKEPPELRSIKSDLERGGFVLE
jgi:hypothetical protein